jgi:cyclohexanecarboxyl-CoA dehydrogenase
MDFALTAQQLEYQAEARNYADKIAQGYQQREKDGYVPEAMRREMGDLGLIAPELPVELGGRGLDRLTSGLILEQIARGDFNVSYVQVVGSLVGQILAQNAQPSVAKTWVPRICSGESIVGIGLSEPEAGSDAGMPRLKAERRDGGWVLNGVKSMSFNQSADAVVVFAKTDPDTPRGRGISAFLVPMDAAGVSRERFSDMGTVAVGRGAAHFDDAWIPEDHLLGEEGKGFTQVMQGFDFSRALIGLQCLAVAKITVDETWEYVSHREAFDQPLSKFQGVSFPLAEAETMIAAAQLLCYQTLWLKDQGLPHTSQAAMCKWWAPKVSFDIVKDCLLLHGQFGYKTDRPIEQRLRDVLGLQIGDGTAQIMKMIIARQAIGREFAP